MRAREARRTGATARDGDAASQRRRWGEMKYGWLGSFHGLK